MCARASLPPPGTERGAGAGVPRIPDGSARAADEQLGGPPASWKGGDMDRAGRLSVESSGDAAGTQARDRIKENGRLRCARAVTVDGRKPGACDG